MSRRSPGYFDCVDESSRAVEPERTAGSRCCRSCADGVSLASRSSGTRLARQPANGVQNLLEVEPPDITLSTVKKAIGDALDRHTSRVVNHVKIAIEGDTVKLTGEVPSFIERAAVEGAVRGTSGVRRVDSRLRIHP